MGAEQVTLLKGAAIVRHLVWYLDALIQNEK